ncbi:MAG TPA: hypothetical protein P5181_01070 [Dermatophilaceae bacterium]|nr:hypothetical protein [Dermatophilaceae bacterium]
MTNAIVANGDVTWPALPAGASITYTSRSMCLAANRTYSFCFDWSLWNCGYRRITLTPTIVNASTGVTVTTGAVITATLPGAGNPTTTSCSIGVNGAQNGTNSGGNSCVSVTPATATAYRLVFTWTYGTGQTCFCGCLSRSNQLGIANLTVSGC